MESSTFTNRLMLYRTKCLVDAIRAKYNLSDVKYSEMLDKFVNIQYILRTTERR